MLPPSGREPRYGTTDYTQDLAGALEQIKKAHEAFYAIPLEERENLKTPAELLVAHHLGKLKRARTSEEKPKEASEAASS